MHRDHIAKTLVARTGKRSGEEIDAQARTQLVALLRQAARLEHCLLNAYVFTACSLKSRPEEFASLPEGGGSQVENQRRAVQFELARDWKTHLLDVSKEEMLHLHYVNCLLRGLGERPEFGLPPRGEKGKGGWFVEDWQPIIRGEPQQGVHIPLEGLTQANARNFVIYESTDAMQLDNAFNTQENEQLLARFEPLREWELKLRIETVLYNESKKDSSEEQKTHLAALREELRRLYEELPPREPVLTTQIFKAWMAPPSTPPQVRFRSIADFYNRAILPLYQQAYDFGWVKNFNHDLNNELQSSQAQEGFFLRVGPVYRGKNFEAAADQNKTDPLRDYKRVEDIVQEIVSEGEGFAEFEQLARELVTRPVSDYLAALRADQRGQGAPEWLERCERLRQSHLYRFALVMSQRAHEARLCQDSGLGFSASREPLALNPLALRQLAEQLPAHFNACYLVVCAWLSRLYETQDWLAGKSRRLSIEMLATWPLMSLAIRPFLELASFLGPEVHEQLFRQDEDGLMAAPTHALQLLRLFREDARSEEICAQMDYLALRVLDDVADWAREQGSVVEQCVQDPLVREMMRVRLKGLSDLGEFKKQFNFRVHGGYSGQAPDLTYLQSHPEGARYEEDPTGQIAAVYPGGAGSRTPLFDQTLLLRLRFQGWGRVQLATDPDPPTDEVGCSGTHMLHAADAPAALDRSLFWQPHPGAIVREPLEQSGAQPGGTPGLGVQCISATLLVADQATAAYKPYGVMSSTGAVQASGTQSDLFLDGVSPLLSLTAEEIVGQGKQLRVDLKPRADGRRPFLVGENHLIWQDGEPIDPFIFAVSWDGQQPGEELSREVFNEGRSLMDFTPLERVMARRGPTGFDGIRNVPDWVKLPPAFQKALEQPDFPWSFLEARANALTAQLASRLPSCLESPSQKAVDQVVSFAERARRFNKPRGTTLGWLGVALHYSHTVSGQLNLPPHGGQESPLLEAFRQRTNLPLRVRGAPAQRGDPNARWLVHYTLGAMDTDTLANFVHGEVYIPLTLEQTPSGAKALTFSRKWSFAPGMLDTVRAYACDFTRPFWAHFELNEEKTQRRTRLKDGSVIDETLGHSDASGYTYAVTSLPSVSAHEGRFDVRQAEQGAIELAWTVQFECASAEGIMSVIQLLARTGQDMTSALKRQFSPREVA